MSAELFIEIRCEELPARFVGPAAAALESGVRALLDGLVQGDLRVWATPRRLAVSALDVAPARAAVEKLITGPPESAAFKDGAPTPAGVGFARRYGLEASDLEIVDGPKGRVIAVRQRAGGERTVDVVAAGLEALVLGIPFARSMRWGSGKVRWGRPLHGVVALYGGELIPAKIAHIETGRVTFGHRLFPEPLVVHEGRADWLAGLEARRVEPDPVVRRERILGSLAESAAALGVEVKPMTDLVDEVVNLVEWPVVVVGTIAPELLHLPPRLLVESMKVHQRVFPLFRGSDLDHHFLVVTNHPLAHEPEVARTIGVGNAYVLASRFHDARHFYAEDRKIRLEERWPNLQGMGWIRKGGTMADKSERLVRLAAALAPLFDADPELAARAALLCKCDLATQMVGEFPELQGHVGRLLAAHQGEEPAVSMAIEEHYLPRNADDALPTTAEGRALALADRLDTLVGCFVLDQKPKGGGDPLGLRRAANGVVQILLDAGVRVSLDRLFEQGLAQSPGYDSGKLGDSLRDELVDFTLTRLRAQLQGGAATEYVDAVLATGDHEVVALTRRLEALVALSRTDGFGALKTTFKRVIGLTRDVGELALDPNLLAHPAEHALYAALVGAREEAERYETALDYRGALGVLATLKAPVDALFDAVMVMAEDPTVRATRLALLRRVADAFGEVADFTHLSAES